MWKSHGLFLQEAHSRWWFEGEVPPFRLMFLNTWSTAGGASGEVMESWEGSALLKKVRRWGWARVGGFLAPPYFLSCLSAFCVWLEMWSASCSRLSASLACCHVFLSEMDSVPLEPKAKLNHFPFKLALAMALYHSNRKWLKDSVRRENEEVSTLTLGLEVPGRPSVTGALDTRFQTQQPSTVVWKELSLAYRKAMVLKLQWSEKLVQTDLVLPWVQYCTPLK